MDWTVILIALITAVPPTLVAAAAYLQASKTHQAVNSRMTELLELTRIASGDAATLAEREAAHVRKGEAAASKRCGEQ